MLCASKARIVPAFQHLSTLFETSLWTGSQRLDDLCFGWVYGQGLDALYGAGGFLLRHIVALIAIFIMLAILQP